MPFSGSTAGIARSSNSRDSRSRLNTTDSNSHYRGDRARSGSPSEYYRAQMNRKDVIFNTVYDMNMFIHKGIDKFLDKQAVRDLIIEYDTDDIFVDGADIFFGQVAEEMGEVDFSRNDKRRLLDVVNIMVSTKTDLNSLDQGGAPENRNGGVGVGGTKRNRTQPGAWTNPRSSLWNSFFTAITITIFNVHLRQKSALTRRRRDTEIFDSQYP